MKLKQNEGLVLRLQNMTNGKNVHDIHAVLLVYQAIFTMPDIYKDCQETKDLCENLLSQIAAGKDPKLVKTELMNLSSEILA